MVVGLTGGVATGKSLVSSELKRLGAHIVDADAIARDIVKPGKPAYEEIIKEFGNGVLTLEGAIDRKALGELVFSDPEKLTKLNRITHPRIRAEIAGEVERIEKQFGDALIIVDVALLIEFGLYKKMSKVVLVTADDDKQFERLKKRNCLADNEAKARIAAQMPLKEKERYADYIIDNNGPVEETLKAVKELYETLEKDRKKGIDTL